MNMNVDLLLKILMDNEDFYLLAPEELIIQFTKLKMYYEEINTLEKGTILRLVALKEIEKAKKIRRYNKMALEEEIQQLSIILEMYSYRKTAISIELKNYYDVLCTKDLKNQDNNILNERLNKLLFMTKGIVTQEEISKYDDIKTKIAILERECERYAYFNKEEAEKLKKSYDLSSEGKILLFYEYGKKYYDDSFIREFYKYKFNELTRNINNNYLYSPITKEDYGFIYYKDIILSKIENIQNSYYFSNLISDDADIDELLKEAKKYLKNDYSEFDFEEILTNKLKLAFILSLDYENGLKDFFNNNVINPYKHNEYEEVFRGYVSGIYWYDSIPLASLFEVMTDEVNCSLYSFYKLSRINTNLLIPFGVKCVDFSKLPEGYILKIKGDVLSGKKYCLPELLTSVTGNLGRGGLEFSQFYFNDGVNIERGAFGLYANKVSIPSSVNGDMVDFDSIISNPCDIIEFRDFKNSGVVSDKLTFLKFIESFTYEIDLHKSAMHYPSKHNLEIQEKYRKGGFSTSNHAALFDRKYKRYFYETGMDFQNIRFTSDDLEYPVVIPAIDLTTRFEKSEGFFRTSERIGGPNYSDIYEKIRNILIEKTGYDIKNEKDDVKTLGKTLNK